MVLGKSAEKSRAVNDRFTSVTAQAEKEDKTQEKESMAKDHDVDIDEQTQKDHSKTAKNIIKAFDKLHEESEEDYNQEEKVEKPKVLYRRKEYGDWQQ